MGPIGQMPLDHTDLPVLPTWRDRIRIHPAAQLLPLMSEGDACNCRLARGGNIA
jgi:hypothetical protein